MGGRTPPIESDYNARLLRPPDPRAANVVTPLSNKRVRPPLLPSPAFFDAGGPLNWHKLSIGSTLLLAMSFGTAFGIGQQGRSADVEHQADVEQVSRWYREFRREMPTESVERLERWVQDHPKDGESLFLLSRVNVPLARRKDPEATRRCLDSLQRAAAVKHSAAMAELGYLMIVGEGVPKDVPAGVELIRAALRENSGQGHLIYGSVCLLGLDGEPPRQDEAIEHLRIAVEKGTPKALAALWLAYERTGRGGEHIDLLRKGAESGDPQAQAFLARLHTQGRYVDGDPKQAELWARRSAELGEPQYQRALAEIYLGLGSSKGTLQAQQWLKLADEGGDMTARYLLGIGYVNGAGRPDGAPELGLKMVREAAEAGVAEAEGALGDQYLLGLMIERDLKEARRWHEKAAAHGRKQSRQTLQWMQYAEQRTAKADN